MEMLSRREFLVGGVAGLAGGAMGKPIRGCIGAGRFCSYENGEVSAADYVQHGLIHLYDGIENIELGIHDENATAWVDLIGGVDLVKGTNVRVSDDGFSSVYTRTTCTPQYACTIDKYIDCAHYEVVGSKLADSSVMFTQRMFGSNDNIAGVALFDTCIWVGKLNKKHYYLPVVPSMDATYSVSAPYSDSGYGFVNGEQLMLQPNAPSYYNWGYYISLCNHRGNYGGTNTYGGVKCLRIYDRILSRSEVLWNYTIDQARFGI